MALTVPKTKITVYLDGRGSSWIARAYNDDTEKHVWSSEGASSPTQALREVAEAIERSRSAPKSEEDAP